MYLHEIYIYIYIYIVDNSIYSKFFINFFKFKFFNDPLKRNSRTATVWPTVILYIKKKWDFCIQLYVLYYVMLWIQLAPVSSLNP